MKELDFDELDRAVNTLMGDASSAPAPRANDDDTTTLDIPSTLGSDQPVPVFTPPTEPSSTPVVSAPVPAARRGGRFMDVVHPSSDMKTATGAPVRPISRQGVTIAPNVPSRQPEVAPAPDTTEVSTAATPSQAWPDPLDMAGYQREPDTTAPAVEPEIPEIIQEVPTAELTEPPTVSSEPDDEQPLSTPFLSDAKVEKRPLGTNSTEELDHAPVSSAVASEDETPNAEDQLPAMPEPTPVVLPAELQTDVLSIESDAPVEAESEKNTDKESQSEVSDESKSVTAAVATPAGPTSIQQQYTEQPSTGDTTTGGIYDTDSYHQPLAHPAKKKSGWMWVIWVLLLLILGAAGGAIAYLYLLK